MDNAIVGVVNFALVQLAKKIQVIPISTGQTARIRIAVGVLSVVGVLLTDYLNGTLESSSALSVIGDAGINYLVSVGIYAGIIKK